MSSVRALKKAIPTWVKRPLKNFGLHALLFMDPKKKMIPPPSMNFVGDGDFRSVGKEFKSLFKKYGGLKASDRVLDIGCGIGRMAIPLTGFLSGSGSYEGFDMVKSGVEWCQNSVSSRYPNFRFRHADIRNKGYNPDGIYRASAFTFPYETASFDFVFLTSVFTHMFPLDVENYMSEISRVLKSGGTCFSTFFLMNQDSLALVEQGKSTQNFIHTIDGCFTNNLENPECAIAFDETYVCNLFESHRLPVRYPIHYGSWCGREKYLSYQDIVIGTKA